MILKKVEIENFRKFNSATLSFDKDITLLAGANNSGKTSIIEILNQIINNPKQSISISDLPVKLVKNWIDSIYVDLYNLFTVSTVTDQTIQDIINLIFSEEGTPKIIPKTKVKFTVDYDPSNDDLRNFADYIMDFDENKHSFYFVYSLNVSQAKLSKLLKKDFTKLKKRFENIASPETNNPESTSIKDKITSLYVLSLTEYVCFTDSNFENESSMDIKDFRSLFNFKNMCATRPLDDQVADTSRNLSKNLISLSSHNDEWNALIEELPDKILHRVESDNITDLVQRTSITSLTEAIGSISAANGGNTGNMVLNIDVTEDSIKSLISQITNAKYQIDEFMLGESSQGLGYSNMIYILVELENYKRSIDPLIVNMFFIEEPESHMHPQMQNVFGKYLRKYYEQKKIQGLITTHSSEIVRVTDLKKLRISRSIDKFSSIILDLSDFKDNISGDEELDNFFDWFFEVGFSEVVFADRVIFYEGDTERLLIRKLSTFEEFKKLNELYVAFIQVGGAYAYNYKKLIDFLKIKSLIITDIDYPKGALGISRILRSNITNSTIRSFYKDSNNDAEPTVADLYGWKTSGGNIILNNSTYICFQTEEDGYARTLEEAMLSKHFNINAFQRKRKSTWCTERDSSLLKYTIPNPKNSTSKTLFSVRDIVEHTSNRKTDFMYSVILNDYTNAILPPYLRKGLLWLIQ